jgi:hypothetical protein
VYSASQVDCAMMEGKVDVASMTAPRMYIKYPPVDRQESGQSWKEESVKATIEDSARLLCPLSFIC